MKDIPKKYGIDEENEDVTMYGEFVSTFHHWVALDEQKEIVKRLQDISKNNRTF